MLAVVALGGCSTFRRTKRVDFTPFAEYTISLASELEYGFGEDVDIVHLDRYLDEPSVVVYLETWTSVQQLIRAVVAYSMEVTTLGSSRLSGSERSRALAEFTDDLVRPVIAERRRELGITEPELDRIVADIEARTELLDALKAAQPIVDAIARVSDDIFDEVKAAHDVARADVARRIEERYVEENLAQERVQETLSRLFRSVALLGESRDGDPAALSALFASNPDLAPAGEADATPTPEQLRKIEDSLWSEIRRAMTFQEQLQPVLERYHAERRELARVARRDVEDLRKAHVTVLMWSRVHDRLAKGVTDPARVDLFEISKQAVELTPFR